VVDDRAVALILPPKSTITEITADDRGIEKSVIATGADKVWSQLKIKGAGVVVAGQDTGVDWTHPALKAKYRGWDGSAADHRYNWHDSIHGKGSNPCGYDQSAPCDDDQHGTHTMGTMVGDDGAGNQVGMAPDAKWIACRNMDQGRGKPSTYIECFEWFLAPYPQGGNPRTDGDPSKAPDVVNNSWGCDGSEGCSGDEIIPAIRALAAAGVVIVASAGNDGPSCSTINSQPATDSVDTITVGAYDYRNNSIASFSSRGPSTLDGQLGPQVAAPGVGIRSSVPGGGYEGGWDGTSMAGPHVVGAAALLIAANPALRGKPAAVMQALRSTCIPKTSSQKCGNVAGSAIPNNTWGNGIIDALKATQAVAPR
jgi:serine protease AprX